MLLNPSFSMDQMKIALFGYGKMGKLVESLAIASGHSIVSRAYREIKPLNLHQADVAIDFSDAEAVIPHLELCLAHKIPVIIGTTGWEESLSTVRKMVIDARGACLYGPNFSIGISIFQQIVKQAALLLKSFSNYDVYGIEYHHRQKKDAPSGTAKQLTQTIREVMPQLPAQFAFSSIRCGQIPGTHTLCFDSPVDTITLCHEARNREGFAQGALLAAKWIILKKGFFTFENCMQDQLRGIKS